MRRSDREITSREALLTLLEACDVCRLGLCDEGQPYIVPLNYGFLWDESGLTLYFHGAREGRKLAMLARNNRVCVEFDRGHALVPGDLACQWSMAYESAIGEGIGELTEDPDERRKALDCIMRHYSGRGDWPLDARILSATAVIRVRVLSFTGKRRSS